MQTGTRATNLPGHQRQRDQAARIVGAMYMLRDAHAPENHRPFGGRKGARYFAQRFGGDATQWRHLFRTVVLRVLFQGFEVRCAIANEVFVHKSFVDDRMDHCVQHRDIGVGLELQLAPGVPPEFSPTWVGDDQFRTIFYRVFYPSRRDGMVRRRIRTDQENNFSLGNIRDLIGDGARSHTFEQCRDGRGMAKTRAVVNVVSPETGSHQFLK